MLPNYKDKSQIFGDFASHLLIDSTFGLFYVPGNLLGLKKINKISLPQALDSVTVKRKESNIIKIIHIIYNMLAISNNA